MADGQGFHKLARVMQTQIARNQQVNTTYILDFGEIQVDYSLCTNTFPLPIPQNDYLVCRHLTIGAAGADFATTRAGGGLHDHGTSGRHTHADGTHGGHESGDGAHTHTGGDHVHIGEGFHTHSILLPEKMRKLSPGDRVLVAWVGQDAVVIDLIVPAANL